jgi:hypothetical protein
MDAHSSSKEPGGYLKKGRKNDRIQALRGMQPPRSWDEKTLSKKDTLVKMFGFFRNLLNFFLTFI